MRIWYRQGHERKEGRAEKAILGGLEPIWKAPGETSPFLFLLRLLRMTWHLYWWVDDQKNISIPRMWNHRARVSRFFPRTQTMETGTTLSANANSGIPELPELRHHVILYYSIIILPLDSGSCFSVSTALVITARDWATSSLEYSSNIWTAHPWVTYCVVRCFVFLWLSRILNFLAHILPSRKKIL